MIPSLLWLLLAPVHAQEQPDDDDQLSEYRLPFSVLVERSLGVASKPVEYNWRESQAMVAATGSHSFELNNFNSMRAGGMVRIPSDRILYELGVSYVFVWDSPSSERLAYTPYRQPGRPPRIEVDVTVGLPLAEGVVTAMPRRFPALQLVFSAYVSMRYLVYPMSYQGLRGRELAGALASPTLTADEMDNLEGRRLDAMQIDPARYGLMAGIGNDIYFSQGLFISPRAMFAVPLLAPATETELWLWADFSLAIGVAF